MNLREIRAAHPHLFLMRQDWFDDPPQAFMDRDEREGVDDYAANDPSRFTTYGEVVTGNPDAYHIRPAVQLVAQYVKDPSMAAWSRYLWTGDRDSQGQRIYMGVNNGLMEIHRHIHITERFGVPIW